ncbi:hypothetical protein ACFFLM_26280 [Deinococcus oregonensis]|uniref:ABC transmembrane type-1 domain-containing protein n=1 Tax=Deinococcus oregonensis TaxID=1805970 RepID=A0ABV6B6Q3_9DEIO
MTTESAVVHGSLPVTDSRALSLLTTEHFALQGLRSSTIADSSSRASLYLASISGTLVALSLLGNAAQLGAPFVIAALIITPTLIFLGLATFARVLQSALEDSFYAMGINRIRHLYLELVPEFRPYFLQSEHDDIWGVLANMGSSRGGPGQMLLTTAGAVGTINSVLIGSFAAGLALALSTLTLTASVVLGLLVFVLSAGLHYRYQQRAWWALTQRHPALFPSEAVMAKPVAGQ